jgi:hypothetical protein
MSSPITSPSSDNYTTCEQSLNLTNRYSKTGAKLRILCQTTIVDLGVKDVLNVVSYCFGGTKLMKFSLPLIFKNGFVGDITFSSEEEIFTKSPLALF